MEKRQRGSSQEIDLESQKRRARRRREQQRKARRKARLLRAFLLLVLFLVLIGCIWGVAAGIRFGIVRKAEDRKEKEQQIAQEEELHAQKEKRIEEAREMATVYDYQGAIDLLKGIEGYENDEELLKALADFESAKSTLINVDVMKIPHIYIGSVCVDPEYTFSKEDSSWVSTVNKNSITVFELNQMLDQLYENGYVLVSIRDLIRETETKDGGILYTRGKIMLPEGKKAFILSQDDVSYPFLLQNSGFASRMILDSQGKVTCEYVQQDGSTVTGDYDLVPILNRFIEEHPDFVYKNARPTLCLSGYNGILGYRTSQNLGETAEFGNIYADYGVFDYQAEIEAVKPVLKALSDEGWTFAMNGYASVNYSGEYEDVSEDVQKWQDNVGRILESATGKNADILMFPFGSDIADWRGYDGNEKFSLLYNQGIRFFCNIQQGDRYWVQIHENYVRQGRRAENGLRMYQDLNEGTDWLSDLFDVSSVYDVRRPTTGLAGKGSASGGNGGTVQSKPETEN